MDELTLKQIRDWKVTLPDKFNDADDDGSCARELGALCDMALAYLSAKEGREGAMVEARERVCVAAVRMFNESGHQEPEDVNELKAASEALLKLQLAIIRASLAEKGGVE